MNHARRMLYGTPAFIRCLILTIHRRLADRCVYFDRDLSASVAPNL